MLQDDREKALRKRALRNTEKLSVGTKELVKLDVQDTVQVQNQVGNHPSRWDITGTVVEVRPYDQYIVRVHGSGRLTARNRKFLRKITPYTQELPAHYPPTTIARDSDTSVPIENPSPPLQSDHQVDIEPVPQATTEDEVAMLPSEHRRSTRIRTEPSRLQVDWKAKTYEKPAEVVIQPEDCLTASHSVAYTNSLHHARLGGGEGIYGGGCFVPQAK